MAVSRMKDFEPEQRDVAERFSRSLDQLPGFRERHDMPRPIAWVRENSTRKWAFGFLGLGLLAGAIGILRRERPSAPENISKAA